MSGREIAEVIGIQSGEEDRLRASLMNKLNATKIADAVRVGLYARIDQIN